MATNMIVYPFGIEAITIIKHKDELIYNLTAVIAPKGSQLTNKDAYELDQGVNTNVIVTDDFESQLQNCDVVYFAYEKIVSGEAYILNIQKAIDAQKKVVVSRNVYEMLLKKDKRLSDIVHCIKNNDTDLISDNIKLLDINVPVIMVMGLGPYCSKFDIQLSLRSFFIANNYSVLQLGSNEQSHLFGFQALPEFLFEMPNIKDRIFTFNKYVHDLVVENKSDIVIIGVPGGITPLSNYDVVDFGEMAFLITNAITPDITLFSIYHDFYGSGLYDKLSRTLKNKFNITPDYFHLSNTKLLSGFSEFGRQRIIYANDKIDNVITKLQTIEPENRDKTFNIMDSTTSTNVFNKILNDLIDNPEII